MALQRQDLVALSNADPKTKKIDYANKLLVLDTESVVRLKEEGYCDKKGNLTDKGVKAYDALQKKIEILKAGVPFTDRKNADHQRIADSANPWKVGTIKKKEYMTDGFFFCYGKPFRRMMAEKGSSDLRKKMPIIVNKVAGMKNLTEIVPHTWMVHTFGGAELIWLVDKSEKLLVPVQTMYFDFLKFKYPSATFYTTKDGEGKTPIQCRVANRGITNDVVGIIMPLEIDDTVPRPKLGGGDGKT